MKKSKNKKNSHKKLTKSDSNSQAVNLEFFECSPDYSSDYFLDFNKDLEIELPRDESSSSSNYANIVDYESFILQESLGYDFKSESIENQTHVLSGSTLDLVFQHLNLIELKQVR